MSSRAHYNWHRYYDPASGRYLTPDPIGLAGGINPYRYANADPVNWFDPDGLAPNFDYDGDNVADWKQYSSLPTQATVPSLSAGDMALMATPMLFGMPPMPPKLSKRAPIKKAQLPTNCEGKVRYVPPENWHPSEPLPRGPGGGYKDKFGNEWTKGPSRTKGQPFEWDVQRPDGSHWNVSLDGKVTH